MPEQAVNVPLTREKVEGQLGRTGGTPFHCEKATARVDEGLSLPLSALNALRRQVLEKLSQERARPPERKTGEYHPGCGMRTPKASPALTVSVRRCEQITPELLGPEAGADLHPLRRGGGLPRRGPPLSGGGGAVSVQLPRICWDRELSQLEQQLNAVKELGVQEALAGTLDGVRRAKELGFQVRSDFASGCTTARPSRS